MMRDESPTAKRARLDAGDDESPLLEMHGGDETRLAALRCLDASSPLLGVASDGDGDELSLHQHHQHQLQQRIMTTQEEKEMRKERGELLLKLFRQTPILANCASARRIEKNQERAAMWENITNKVNAAFGAKLEVLTVEKVKKLLTYYKKKEDGSYDNIKMSSQHLFDDDGVDATSVTSEVTDDGSTRGRVIIEELSENKDLLDFLALMTSTVTTTTPAMTSRTPVESVDLASMRRAATADNIFQLKKDRHDFVVALAEYYMQRMCFDSSSRSAAVNAERHNMWIKITHKANEKFGGQIGTLGVEQAKKLFSNCKRRRRARQERSDEDSSQPSPQGSSGTEREELFEDMTSADSPAPGCSTDALINLEQLMRGLDRSAEYDDLRKQVLERDAEIALLRRKVAEQAEDYATKVKAILELLKVAIDKKVSDDVTCILSS